MSYYIYKHINDKDEVIYIGQTTDIHTRQSTHKNISNWKDEIFKIEYCEVYDKYIMDIMERYYISKYKPKYNLEHIDCDYSYYFKVIKELDFKEYVKPKPFHRFRNGLLDYSEIKPNTLRKYKPINKENLIVLRGIIDDCKEVGNVSSDRNIDFINLDDLWFNYKMKMSTTGFTYFCRCEGYSNYICKYIYNFEDLDFIYECLIIINLLKYKWVYGFNELLSNSFENKYKISEKYKPTHKTHVSNIKSKIKIFNTEYIDIIEYNENFVLGIIYGICFRIPTENILDTNKIESIYHEPQINTESIVE